MVFHIPSLLWLVQNKRKPLRKYVRAELLTNREFFWGLRQIFFPPPQAKCAFYSLGAPHPMLWTPVSNPHEVAKTIVQCRMLSSHYRIALLTRHWSSSRNEFCQIITCFHEVAFLEHILLVCPHYTCVRVQLWSRGTDSAVHLCPGHPLPRFLLDTSAHPTVITLVLIFLHYSLVLQETGVTLSISGD